MGTYTCLGFHTQEKHRRELYHERIVMSPQRSPNPALQSLPKAGHELERGLVIVAAKNLV